MVVIGRPRAPIPSVTVPGLIASTVFLCPDVTAVGDVVYLDGDDQVGLALATTIDRMPAFGIVQAKSDATHCYVQFAGEASLYTGLVIDVPYFVSDTQPGKLSLTPPSSPGSVVQKVGSPRNASTLILTVSLTDYFVRSV